MKQFDADGFFSDAGIELETAIRARYSSELSLAKTINRDCHTLLFGCNVHNDDAQEILVATLFLRVLEHFQGVISLLEMGMVAPARATLRVMLEAVFATRAVASSENLVKPFIVADLPERLKLMNKARHNNYEALKALRDSLSDEIVNELSAEIARIEAKQLKAEQLSRAAGMHDWYVTVYTLLSAAVHSTVRDLESYLEISESDLVRSLTYAPQLDDIGELAHTASHTVLLGAGSLDTLFDRNFGLTLDAHIAAINADFVGNQGEP